MKDTLPRPDTAARDKIYDKVDTEASFIGGEASWRSYIEQNINPLVPGKNNAPPGTYTVVIQFVIGTDGKITGIKPLTKFGYGMESEVIRLLKKSPPWVPAKVDGKPVRVYRKQPVSFMVVATKKKN